MVSGGLDSSIAAKLHPKALPIFVDMGQPYAASERAALGRCGIQALCVEARFINSEYPKSVTPEDQIIPGRNGFLAMMGAHYADEVWICALDGEMHGRGGMWDKSHEFYAETSRYLSQLFQAPKVVKTPFVNLTKAELVRKAMLNGITREWLLSTSTCYDPGGKCGSCSTCFKRWVAFTLNGVTEQTRHPTPWTSPPAREAIEKYKGAVSRADYTHYSKQRIAETYEAVAKVGGMW